MEMQSIWKMSSKEMKKSWWPVLKMVNSSGREDQNLRFLTFEKLNNATFHERLVPSEHMDSYGSYCCSSWLRKAGLSADETAAVARAANLQV